MAYLDFDQHEVNNCFACEPRLSGLLSLVYTWDAFAQFQLCKRGLIMCPCALRNLYSKERQESKA